MSKIKITSSMRSSKETREETFYRSYDKEGNLCETMLISSEEDYFSGSYRRKSPDNGRTWSEWARDYDDSVDGRRGRVPGVEEGDEMLGGCSPYLYDPKTGCTVGVGSTFYYIRGHDVGYYEYWEQGIDNIRMHAYFSVRRPDGSEETRLIELEEGGADFDPKNPRNPAFLDKNRAMADSLIVLPDGDLCFNLYPTVRLGCKIAGIDVNAFFPSCPDLHYGLIVVRLHWNPEKNDYDMIFSNVIMLGDLQSSRCIMEPQMQIFPDSGRWIIVFRGSNVMSEVWHTRTDPTTPGFKWYVISDDGGRTFSPPTPWHFDTKEVVYSSATISAFYRHAGNGKLYWLGNIMDDPSVIDGNDPRWPYVICEVNEKYGCLIKDTLTVVDSLRPDETRTELSNPDLFVNRETGCLEIRITKIGMVKVKDGQVVPHHKWYSEAWEYTVSFED